MINFTFVYMENFTNRLLKILENKNLSASQFAEKIGVQRSSVSHILSGRNKPSLDFIIKIITVFSDISLDWLIKGVKSDKTINIQKEISILPSPIENISINESTENKIKEIVFFTKIILLRFLKIELSLSMKLPYSILFILLISCFNQERNCKEFQYGRFEFESISSSGDILKTRFIRTKDIEVDYFNNHIDSSYVNWVSECECILKKINPKNLSDQKSVQMKILTTSKDEYVFEYSFVGDIENRNRGKAKKISD